MVYPLIMVVQADVVDHVENILNSMDMFSAIAENLIDYTFNLNSAETNETMCVILRMLTESD
jgi:hypothetical protein